VEVAGRCGIKLDSRTLSRSEVQGWCPFCSTGSTGYHLHLNPGKERFYCHKCSANGNSVTLYARIFGVSNYEASRQLSEGGVFIAPERENPPVRLPEYDLASVRSRHDVYYTMLEMMDLSPKHTRNLTDRGLSRERIIRNLYRSMPESSYKRRDIAESLARRYDLRGVPGFYYSKYGHWELWGKPGILIPVCNVDGHIQGLQIRLDGAVKQKYRWLSSNPDYGYPYGTPSSTWVHVTGNRNAREAFVTEGGLKGDIASYLSGDRLFACTAGATSIRYLKETVLALGVTKLFGCFDMDKVAELFALDQKRRENPQDIQAQKPCPLERMEAMVKASGLSYERQLWAPGLNGIDEYYLDWWQQQNKRAA